MTEFKVKHSMLGICIKMTATLAEAILLYRIHGRCELKSTMKDKKEEEGWCVLTRKQWTFDTQLSLKQYKSALAALKEKGLIKYKHIKITRVGAAPIWIKPTKETYKIIRDLSKNQSSPEGPLPPISEVPTGTIAPFQSPLEGPSNKKGVIIKGVKRKGVSPKSNKDLESNLGKRVLGKKKMKKEKTDKAKKILKSKQGKSFDDIKRAKPEPRDKSFAGVKGMEIHWAKLIADHSDDEDFFSGWTGREQGFAKAILTSPKGRPVPDMLEVAVQQWSELCEYIQEEAGLTRAPNQPSVGFLSANRDLLYKFYKMNKVNKDVSSVQSVAKKTKPEPRRWKSKGRG